MHASLPNSNLGIQQGHASKAHATDEVRGLSPWHLVILCLVHLALAMQSNACARRTRPSPPSRQRPLLRFPTSSAASGLRCAEPRHSAPISPTPDDTRFFSHGAATWDGRSSQNTTAVHSPRRIPDPWPCRVSCDASRPMTANIWEPFRKQERTSTMIPAHPRRCGDDVLDLSITDYVTLPHPCAHEAPSSGPSVAASTSLC